MPKCGICGGEAPRQPWRMSAMNAQIIIISGSPINNSNTDRLVQAVLHASELRTEFVKD